MAYLISQATAEWIRRAKAAGLGNADLRGILARFKVPPGDETLPFTLGAAPDPQGGGSLLVVYLPWDGDFGYVFRNGTSVPKSQYLQPYGESMPDWYVITTLDGQSDGRYLVFVGVGPTGTPENPEWPSNQIRGSSEWGIFLDGPSDQSGRASPEGIAPFGVLEIETVGEAPDQRTVYRVYNTSYGPFSFDWVETDEEAAIIKGPDPTGGNPAWPRSLTRRDGERPDADDYGAMGIYDFYNPTPLSAGASGEQKWDEDFARDMVLIRHYNADENRFEVAYISLYEFAKGNAEDSGGIVEFPPPDADCQTVDTNPNHLWVWDSCRQKWVRITVGDTATGGRGLDAHYWIQGGTFANCYGASIGNSVGMQAINLDNRILAGDWVVTGNVLGLNGVGAQWQTVDVVTPNGTKRIQYLGLPPQ